MIRIAIIADSQARSQELSVALSHSMELVSTDPEVLIASHLTIEELPPDAPPIVLLTDDDLSPASLPVGVYALLPVDAKAAEITAVVTAAAHGFTSLTDAQRERWLRRERKGKQPDPVVPVEALTAREGQVLRLLAQGMGNKAIARELSISNHTAKFHVGQVLAKFAATSRAEAVAIGIRRGLVPI